jgi:[ribosomal protein S5]-alanine N-acetyltransferase
VRRAPESFETAHLRAERSHRRHLELYLPFEQDERIAAWLGGTSSPDETRERLERELDHWDERGFGRWALFDKVTGEFVGRGGLREVEIDGRPEVELGYAIVAERWGRGLATELGEAAVGIGFRDLGLDELVAFTLPHNVASRRVMEKLGFAYEREFLWKGFDHALYRIRKGSSSDG